MQSGNEKKIIAVKSRNESKEKDCIFLVSLNTCTPQLDISSIH